jgi:hypothetical protein
LLWNRDMETVRLGSQLKANIGLQHVTWKRDSHISLSLQNLTNSFNYQKTLSLVSAPHHADTEGCVYPKNMVVKRTLPPLWGTKPCEQAHFNHRAIQANNTCYVYLYIFSIKYINMVPLLFASNLLINRSLRMSQQYAWYNYVYEKS